MTTPSPSGARPRLMVGMGAVVFVALVILGAGILSYATGSDPIATPGLGALPGAVAIAVAAVAWTGVLGAAAHRRPGLGTALLAGLAAALAQVLTLTVATASAGFATALGVAAHLVVSGFAAITLCAGVLAAVGVAVALRAGSGTPRWPWENDADDE